MKRAFKRIIIVLVIALTAGSFSHAAEGDFGVCVLFFNDVHGHLAPFTVEKDGRKVEMGGIARLAGMVERIRGENRAKGIRTVVLLAGDTLQGTPLSTIFHGAADIDCYNRMKLDAMVVGNHEFDFGLENFTALKTAAKFPIMSANIYLARNGQALCPQYAAFNLGGGATLAVVGVTTPELLTTTAPVIAEKVKVKDPVESIAPLVGRLKTTGPVLVLSHCGWKVDTDIAARVPGIIAVIGGHDQVLLDPPKGTGGAKVFQALEWGKYLGRIDIVVDRVSRRARVDSWKYIPITPELRPDAAVAKIVDDYTARLGARFREVLAENRSLLDGERDRIRYEETNLGDYVADIMRRASRADIALINAGSIRASVQKGTVTMEHVYTMMPYANDIVTVTLSGREIMAVLARAVKATREEEDGGFMHVSGMSVRVKGGQIVSVKVGGAPLAECATYRVAVTDFIASGGDGYAMLKGKTVVRTGATLREAIIGDLKARHAIDAKTDGRFTRD